MEGELQALFDRCTERGLSAEIVSETSREGPSNSLIARVPAGREVREVLIFEGDRLGEVASSAFERYRLIDGYNAIWSDEFGMVECGLDQGPIRPPIPFALRRLAKMLGSDGDSPPSPRHIPRFEFPSSSDGPKIWIGPSSTEHTVLCEMRADRPSLYLRRGELRRRPTLHIEGVHVATHERARTVLEKIGNSVLFQIDLLTQSPIYLSQERTERKYRARRHMQEESVSLSPPTQEFERDPMALYWYARTASGMPLLQFLAHYQVLEFHFPIYSRRDTQDKIKSILKDPTFRPERDKDITRILAVVEPATRGRGFGSEKAQLLATLRACVDPEELTEFLIQDPDRLGFFESKKAKRLARQKLPLREPKADLLQSVAERIYEIRCRIVHTKAPGEEEELILPFSNEARSLEYDLELIEHVVRKVLIAGSGPLRI